MTGIQTSDFDLGHGSCEVVDIYATTLSDSASDNLVATIFYKSNGNKAHRFSLLKEKLKKAIIGNSLYRFTL